MVLDGSKTSFVEEKAKEIIKDPKIGRVVQVYEHLSPEDNSNFEVDVVVDGGQFEERAVNYMGESNDQIAAPMVGDKVIIDYLAGEKKRPICMGTVYTNEDRAPLGRAGMQRDVYESDESPAGTGDIKFTGYTQYTDNPARVDKSEIDPVQTWVQISKMPQTPDPHISDNADMSIEMYESPVSKKDKAHIRLNGNQVDGDDQLSMDTKMDFKEGTTTTESINDNQQWITRVEQDVKNGKTFTEAINNSSGMSTKVEQDAASDLMTLLANDGSNDYEMEFDPTVPSITVRSSGSSKAGFKVNFSTGAVKMIDGSGYGIESDGSGNFTWHYESIDHSQGTTTSL